MPIHASRMPAGTHAGGRCPSLPSRRWLGVLLIASVVGCGGKGSGDGSPGFAMGMAREVPFGESVDIARIPRCDLTITEPTATTRLRSGNSFDCVVRVEVPQGGILASQVLVEFGKGTAAKSEFRQGGVIQDFGWAKPLRRDGDHVYLMSAKVKAPAKPGRYVIRAESTAYVVALPKDLEKELSSTTTINQFSPVVEVEVIP